MRRLVSLASGGMLLAVHVACGASAPPPESVPVTADGTVVRTGIVELAQSFDVGGTVRARLVAQITSRMMAPVEAVRVRPGDRVVAGQALVVLDSRELRANLARADAAHIAATQSAVLAGAARQAAASALTLARLTHERIANLRARNSATPHELDEAVAALHAAEAGLQVAEARVAESAAGIDAASASAGSARAISSYATLTAPFDGFVTERLVDPGSMVTPGQPLLTVEDTRGFRLEVRLDESRAALVMVGSEVTIRLESPDVVAPSSPLAARVTEIARALDPGSHDYVVKIDLPSSGPSVRSGMFARATFTGPPRRALAIPATAVVRRGQLTLVFTVDTAGVARMRLVNISDPVGAYVEVRAGLVDNERVVNAPGPAVADGVRVHETAGRDVGSSPVPVAAPAPRPAREAR